MPAHSASHALLVFRWRGGVLQCTHPEYAWHDATPIEEQVYCARMQQEMHEAAPDAIPEPSWSEPTLFDLG